MEETRIKKELLLEEVGYEKDSIGEVWWSREHLKIKTVWKTQRGCAKRLETWAGSLKVARIMLGTPLETGPCMRQPNISCPLVSYGRLCTQPVLQVLWGTMTLQRKGYQDHWVSPRCTGGGTAEEQKLLLTSHLTHVLQPGLVTVAQTCIYHVQQGQATEAAGLWSLPLNFPQTLAFIRPSWGLNKELLYSWLTFCRNKTLIYPSCPAPYLPLFCLFCKVALIYSGQRRD